MQPKCQKLSLIALVSLLGLGACTDSLSVAPQVLAFDGTQSSTLGVATAKSWQVSSDQAWLSTSAANGTGNATVAVTVDRTNLPAGNYKANLTITSAGETRVVPVFMSFPDIEGNISATERTYRLHEDSQDLVEGEYVADELEVVLNPGGVAVSLGRTIELSVEPVPSEYDYRLAAITLATQQGLSVLSGNGRTFLMSANGQSLASVFERLNADGRVESATPEQKVSFFQAAPVPNDPQYTSQWHYQMIRLPEAWGITNGSADIPLAVIDGGVQQNHPDLASRLLPGYDFSGNKATHTAGQHGTHVAGTMGAASNNGTGLSGVTWLNPIIPIQVLGTSSGDGNDVNNGILFAAGFAVQNSANATVTPSRKARVMNLSLGPDNKQCKQKPPSGSDIETVNRALAAGVVVVVASGNDGCNTLDDLSLIPGVISVAAVDRTGKRASYSNAGAQVWISAPGGGGEGPDGVQSTDVNASYSGISGTSMAAPHVAGVVGLMLAVNPNLKPLDVKQILKQTAQPIVGVDANASGSPTVRGGMGHGLIDAFAAVTAARTWGAPQSRPVVQLVNPATNAVVKTAPVNPAGQYKFENVPPGNYVVKAGNDADNDGQIGEAGEPFAQATITVDEKGDNEVDLNIK